MGILRGLLYRPLNLTYSYKRYDASSMNRGELERHLRTNGATLVRHGRRHDIWRHEENDRESVVPRHEVVNRNTARRICDDLGVPRHPSL